MTDDCSQKKNKSFVYVTNLSSCKDNLHEYDYITQSYAAYYYRSLFLLRGSSGIIEY